MEFFKCIFLIFGSLFFLVSLIRSWLACIDRHDIVRYEQENEKLKKENVSLRAVITKLGGKEE